MRDASGNILSIFTEYPDDSKMYQSEYDMYGSARLGTINPDTLVFPRPVNQTPGNLPLGLKRYELSNHLGNVLSQQHVASVGSFTKELSYNSGDNLLQNVAIGSTDESFTYDEHGNQLASNNIDLIWNELDQLASADLGGGGVAYYTYDGSGQRTRKVIELSDGSKKVRKYIGNFELYQEIDNTDTLTLQRETLHISDDTGRIAMQESRTIGTDDSTAQLWRYIFSNHLQSATLELDQNADIICYEEYYPFGGTSYYASNASINAVAKRYKYSGKEKDEETGLYYYGARYHAPWLCRFVSVDIKAIEYIFQNSYTFASNNPINGIEINGENTIFVEDPLATIEQIAEQEPNNLTNEKAIALIGEAIQQKVIEAWNMSKHGTNDANEYSFSIFMTIEDYKAYKKGQLSDEDFKNAIKTTNLEPGNKGKGTADLEPGRLVALEKYNQSIVFIGDFHTHAYSLKDMKDSVSELNKKSDINNKTTWGDNKYGTIFSLADFESLRNAAFGDEYGIASKADFAQNYFSFNTDGNLLYAAEIDYEKLYSDASTLAKAVKIQKFIAKNIKVEDYQDYNEKIILSSISGNNLPKGTAKLEGVKNLYSSSLKMIKFNQMNK